MSDLFEVLGEIILKAALCFGGWFLVISFLTWDYHMASWNMFERAVFLIAGTLSFAKSL